MTVGGFLYAMSNLDGSLCSSADNRKKKKIYKFSFFFNVYLAVEIIQTVIEQESGIRLATHQCTLHDRRRKGREMVDSSDGET